MVTTAQREVFDGLLDELVAELPPHLAELLEELPLIVEDEPTPQLLREMGMEADDELFGLHNGVALPDRHAEATPHLPDHMMIFRGPILRMVGFDASSQGRRPRGNRGSRGNRRELREQIRITLLHEIGHHFGLDEEDLEELG